MFPALALVLLFGSQDPPAAETLNGAWSVDLATDPTQPYRQPMNLTLQSDGVVTGDFYNSRIEAGRWKRQNERLCVSFRTTDGAGPYHTAACLSGDHVDGQTWAEHRDFVFIWRADRPS
jgi:hypothetical protein